MTKKYYVISKKNLKEKSDGEHNKFYSRFESIFAKNWIYSIIRSKEVIKADKRR